MTSQELVMNLYPAIFPRVLLVGQIVSLTFTETHKKAPEYYPITQQVKLSYKYLSYKNKRCSK